MSAVHLLLHQVEFRQGCAWLPSSPSPRSCDVGQASSGTVIGVRMQGQSEVRFSVRLCIPEGPGSIADPP